LSRITIALDAMSGGHGPSVIVPAALDVLKRFDNNLVHLILVGDESSLTSLVHSYGGQLNNCLSIHPASEVVAMDDPPAQALRFKKDSSMRVAINLVKKGIAGACVSSGNTGALMSSARFVLKTWPGIDRPAISALLPTMKPNQVVRILDLGANVDSSAEQLLQFGIMGSVLASSVGNIAKPKVGLLNVGSEEIKGNEQVKAAAKLFSENQLINYIGYVEGDDIYKGTADVIVCDGFVGNVALKTSEGLAKMIRQYVRDAFTQNWYCKCLAFLARPILTRIAKRFDPSRYNGASLVGLQGTVIKSHGSADRLAFASAIRQAIREVQSNVSNQIGREIERVVAELDSL
jgi:phosphate acyltransferase